MTIDKITKAPTQKEVIDKINEVIDNKYDASNPNGYTSNVGTVTSVNNTSPDSNGNVTISTGGALPSQTGQSGKFLTTDGTDASWANVSGALPTQTGHAGEFLTTDGTDASWTSAVGTQIIWRTYS